MTAVNIVTNTHAIFQGTEQCMSLEAGLVAVRDPMPSSFSFQCHLPSPLMLGPCSLYMLCQERGAPRLLLVPAQIRLRAISVDGHQAQDICYHQKKKSSDQNQFLAIFFGREATHEALIASCSSSAPPQLPSRTMCLKARVGIRIRWRRRCRLGGHWDEAPGRGAV